MVMLGGIELSEGEPDKLFLRLKARIFRGENPRQSASLLKKTLPTQVPTRQKTVAIQDASRISGRLRLGASLWTAAASCRFSPGRRRAGDAAPATLSRSARVHFRFGLASRRRSNQKGQIVRLG